MELHLKKGWDSMKIQANAVIKLQQYFSNFKWSKNCNGSPDPISEEILEALFRKIGANESSTISLITYNENVLAVRGLEPGFNIIRIELSAPEFDDIFKFNYHYDADPVAMTENEKRSILFNDIREYRSFTYDFATREWTISGRC
jgi:hypothetical protein